MFGGKALGWMAGTLIWMPGARRVRAGQTYPLRSARGHLQVPEEAGRAHAAAGG